MRSARGNENRISGTHRNVFQAIFRRTLGYRAPEFLHVNAMLKSDHYLGAFASAHRVPHFRFPAAPGSLLMPRSIIIVRMNLHRKLVFHEQKFHE